MRQRTCLLGPERLIADRRKKSASASGSKRGLLAAELNLTNRTSEHLPISEQPLVCLRIATWASVFLVNQKPLIGAKSAKRFVRFLRIDRDNAVVFDSDGKQVNGCLP